MKQIVLFILLAVVMVVSTNAQIAKGSIWLGGSIGYSENKTDYNDGYPDYKKTNLTVTPAIGKAIKENLVAGIDLTYNNYREQNYSGGTYYTTKQNTYGAGFFLRRYLPIVKNLYVYGQGRLGFDYSKNNQTPASTYGLNSKGWSTDLTFYPGVSYAINKKLQLETGFNNLFQVQYSKTKNDDAPGSPKSHSFAAGINLENKAQFFLGFRFLLNKQA